MLNWAKTEQISAEGTVHGTISTFSGPGLFSVIEVGGNKNGKSWIAYDLVDLERLDIQPFDCFAELDCEETIQAVHGALQSGGHEVILLEADQDFSEKLKAACPEIVFNIAEGRQGDCREAQVPAICEVSDPLYRFQVFGFIDVLE
jgi:hypothetical protein